MEVDVKPQGQVAARHGGAVVLSVLVAPLDAAVNVAQEDLHPFLAAQLLLVRAFDAELADVVAALVEAVLVFVQIFLRHFAHVAEHVGPHAEGVVADGAVFDREALEAEQLLPEDGKLFGRDLPEEELGRVAGVAGIFPPVLDFGHALDVFLFGDADGSAEVERVHALLLFHDDHDVVRRLVVDEQLAAAVHDQAARGVLYLFEEGVRVGVLFVVVAHHLQGEQAYEVDDDDEDRSPADDVFPVAELDVFGHVSLNVGG